MDVHQFEIMYVLTNNVEPEQKCKMQIWKLWNGTPRMQVICAKMHAILSSTHQTLLALEIK